MLARYLLLFENHNISNRCWRDLLLNIVLFIYLVFITIWFDAKLGWE